MHHHIVAAAAPLASALRTIGLQDKATVMLSERDGAAFQRIVPSDFVVVASLKPGGELYRYAEIAGIIFKWPATDDDEGEV